MDRRKFLYNWAWLTAGITLHPSLEALTRGEKLHITNHCHSGDNTGKLSVLVLEGMPRERGRKHGEELRRKIEEHVVIWKDSLASSHRVNADKYISEFLDKTDFAQAIKKWTPELWEEVKGIAEGADVDFETMLAFQLVDEEWWFWIHKQYNLPIPSSKHCSSLGVYGQEGLPNLVAQNLDIPAFTDGFQVLLHIKYHDSELEAFVFSYAGLISLCGLNNYGIGEVVNALLQLDHCADGLPVAFVNRGILERKTHAEAVKFVRSIRHASGQNYTIGSLDKVSAFECSAHKVVEFVPFEGVKRIYHTNHPLVNDDQAIYKEVLKKLPERQEPQLPGNSEIRYKALEKRLKDPARRITVDDVKEALSSRDDPRNPICRVKRKDGGGGFTAGCVIMECSQNPVLHLAPGPACVTPFKAYTYSVGMK